MSCYQTTGRHCHRQNQKLNIMLLNNEAAENRNEAVCRLSSWAGLSTALLIDASATVCSCSSAKFGSRDHLTGHKVVTGIAERHVWA
eukprot:3457109-Amphidinium_carterae.1